MATQAIPPQAVDSGPEVVEPNKKVESLSQSRQNTGGQAVT
jgi:hypothetical protein